MAFQHTAQLEIMPTGFPHIKWLAKGSIRRKRCGQCWQGTSRIGGKRQLCAIIFHRAGRYTLFVVSIIIIIKNSL